MEVDPAGGSEFRCSQVAHQDSRPRLKTNGAVLGGGWQAWVCQPIAKSERLRRRMQGRFIAAGWPDLGVHGSRNAYCALHPPVRHARQVQCSLPHSPSREDSTMAGRDRRHTTTRTTSRGASPPRMATPSKPSSGRRLSGLATAYRAPRRDVAQCVFLRHLLQLIECAS